VSSFVFDSSAILALIKNERGADVVLAALPRASISAVNMAEIVSKLIDLGSAMEPLEQTLSDANVPSLR
jgi:ribonuclease VapC